MAPLSMGRLGRAVRDVLHPIERVRGTIDKVPSIIKSTLEFALVAGGFWAVKERAVMLPESLQGQLLMLALLAGILALGVAAAYRHRAQSEDTERNARREAGRRAESALAEVISHLLYLTSMPFDERRVVEVLPKLVDAVQKYGEAGRQTDGREALNHLLTERNLRAALSLGTPIQIVLGLPPVLVSALQIYSAQVALLEPLDPDERKVLHETAFRVGEMTLKVTDSTLQRVGQPPSRGES